MAERLVGITVMPEFIQTETVNGLLDNIQKRTRATSTARPLSAS